MKATDFLLVLLSDINLNPNNPRLIKDDKFKKLVASIQEFPEMLKIRPIVVNKDMVILGGNMRFKACKEAGLKEVPVIIVDLTEEQQREFIIKDNASGGEWDWEMLANEWDADLLDKWGIDLPEVEQLPDENEDDVPEVTIPITEKGDLWELNNHRLTCGDSTNVQDIDKLMNGHKADLIFTDPPYDLEDNYTSLIIEAAKKDCHIFIMDGDKRTMQRAYTHESFRKFFVVDFRIARMISNNQPMQRTTLIAEFLKGKGKFKNIFDGFTTLIESAVDHKMIDGFNQHKRTELPETFILHYSEPNELICDFFGGAGSTLIASEKNNRICYLNEFEPKHCDIIVKRWINYMKEHAKLLEVKLNGEIFDIEKFD